MKCKITKNFVVSTTVIIDNAQDIDDAYKKANEMVKDFDPSMFVVKEELDSQISEL